MNDGDLAGDPVHSLALALACLVGVVVTLQACVDPFTLMVIK